MKPNQQREYFKSYDTMLNDSRVSQNYLSTKFDQINRDLKTIHNDQFLKKQQISQQTQSIHIKDISKEFTQYKQPYVKNTYNSNYEKNQTHQIQKKMEELEKNLSKSQLKLNYIQDKSQKSSQHMFQSYFETNNSYKKDLTCQNQNTSQFQQYIQIIKEKDQKIYELQAKVLKYENEYPQIMQDQKQKIQQLQEELSVQEKIVEKLMRKGDSRSNKIRKILSPSHSCHQNRQQDQLEQLDMKNSINFDNQDALTDKEEISKQIKKRYDKIWQSYDIKGSFQQEIFNDHQQTLNESQIKKTIHPSQKTTIIY